MTETLLPPTTYGEVLDRHPDMHPDLRAHTERLALSNGETISLQEVEGLGEIADEGAGVVAEGVYGEQLDISGELTGYGQWPITDVQKGRTTSQAIAENTRDFTDVSPLEEHRRTRQLIDHAQAENEFKAGALNLVEYDDRLKDIYKIAREYQYPLLKQNGQLFESEIPVALNPVKGVSVDDGTFWHASNQLLHPGDRLMPAGEVPDLIHAANKEERLFTSSSSPNGTSYAEEQDFTMGVPRGAGYLPPQRYGKHVYKVSSPNALVVPTINGPETWAEGGGRIEQRMHPDFAYNYRVASNGFVEDRDALQPGLPGMENRMQFVPEAELNVPGEVFYDKYKKPIDDARYAIAPDPKRPSAEDIAIPDLEHFGKHPYAPDTSPNRASIF